MEALITNPWLKLIEEIDSSDFNKNYVLKEEQPIVDKFNNKLSNDVYKVHTEIMPAPFMGDVHNAPIVLLLLNPGYDKTEDADNYYSDYRDWWKNEIQHHPTKPDLPFFALHEEYSKSSNYWIRKLKPLIENSGREIVSKNICSIQYFPYHTEKYKNIYKNLLKEEGFIDHLPSQKYNFDLVKKAMERNALIIITRSKKLWFNAIPELAEYENNHFTNSYQNITISKNNLPYAFDKILEKLQ